MNLLIDTDFRNLLPELTSEEYTGLEKSIVKRGIINPILIWNGVIVDGHNRYAIAQAHHIQTIPTKEISFQSKADAMQWIIDNQLARRNLLKSQLVKAYEKYEEERAKEAEAKHRANGGDKVSESAKAASSNLNEPVEKIRTAAEVAKKIGVSENTYRDMKLITNEGTPEQIERMNKGGKGNGVSAIARQIRNRNKPQPTEKKCTKCGEVLPISEFYFDTSSNSYLGKCKNCHNALRQHPIFDAKGKKIKSTGEFSGVSDFEIMGDLYDDSMAKTSVRDVVEEFTVNFNSSLQSLKAILDNHKDIVESKDNKIVIEQMWEDATGLFQALRKEYT